MTAQAAGPAHCNPIPCCRVNAGTLQEAAWAMKFAFASYGVLLYLFAHGPA